MVRSFTASLSWLGIWENILIFPLSIIVLAKSILYFWEKPRDNDEPNLIIGRSEFKIWSSSLSNTSLSNFNSFKMWWLMVPKALKWLRSFRDQCHYILSGIFFFLIFITCFFYTYTNFENLSKTIILILRNT